MLSYWSHSLQMQNGLIDRIEQCLQKQRHKRTFTQQGQIAKNVTVTSVLACDAFKVVDKAIFAKRQLFRRIFLLAVLANEKELSLRFVSLAFGVGYSREMQDGDQVNFGPYRSQKCYVRLHDIWSIASIPLPAYGDRCGL